MNAGDQAVHVIYLLLCLVLVASAFFVRRVPLAQGIKMMAGWVMIFAAAFIIFTFKDEFLALGDRLLVAARGEDQVQEAPGEVRIRQSADGHFWVTGWLNGAEVRFMVDSGATVTSISRGSAEAAGIEARGLQAMVRTANGTVMVDRGRAETLRVGSIERRDLAVHISDTFGDLNVLGMNFLSSLSGWSVEGKTLVLRTGSTAPRSGEAAKANGSIG